MGKLVSNLGSWDTLKNFGGSFIKGALIGIPVTLIVLGLFSFLDAFSLLPVSIQGMNNFPTLLAFNTIFSGASLAVTNTITGLTQKESEPERVSSVSSPQQEQSLQRGKITQIEPGRSAEIKRSMTQVSDASHEGVAAVKSPLQHTIH